MADPWTAELRISELSGWFSSSAASVGNLQAVSFRVSVARPGIRLWPTPETIDHYESLLIECKLEEKFTLSTLGVYT